MNQTKARQQKALSLQIFSEYNGKAYVELNGNNPEFKIKRDNR